MKKVQLGLFVVFVSLIVMGIMRGEATMVLEKAVRICLECIGIG
ncbi:MAG: thioredoxin [Clostridia bacterium]|nr:thioredoxin [Clostridia bacterium]